MALVMWQPIATLNLTGQALTSFWVPARQALGDATLLRFEAKGAWRPKLLWMTLDPCDPDGHLDLPIEASQRLMAEAPFGALLGRLGGSSAAIDPLAAAGDGASAFTVGSYAIIKRDVAKQHGPLFFGINCRTRPLALDQFEIEVSGAVV